jgi:hypothetical protein
LTISQFQQARDVPLVDQVLATRLDDLCGRQHAVSD